MQKITKTIPALVLGLLVAQLALVPAPAAAQGDTDDRTARILANLKLAYPQLEKMNVQMGELKPSGFAGLEEGTFTVNGKQNQAFLVSSDDTKLYLISGAPIDVSRSTKEIATEVAKREEDESKKAAERQQKLETAIAGLPMRGNPEASITIVEFSDFQCPYCTRGADTVEQILEKYGDDVKFAFKHFPLNFHPWAKPASIAAHCAGQQNHDAFWTLHDQFFKNQKQINPDNVLAKSKEYLGDSGIDMAAWAACAEDKDSEQHKAAAAVVDADMALGQSLGVSGTPGFFVNGQFLNGAQPIAAFEPLIAKAKSEG